MSIPSLWNVANVCQIRRNRSCFNCRLESISNCKQVQIEYFRIFQQVLQTHSFVVGIFSLALQGFWGIIFWQPWTAGHLFFVLLPISSSCRPGDRRVVSSCTAHSTQSNLGNLRTHLGPMFADFRWTVVKTQRSEAFLWWNGRFSE